MNINELFPLSAFGLIIACAGISSASAETFTVAPTSVYGSAEAQSTTRFRGPGLPGGEAQQSVSVGTRHPFFTVAGFNGEVYSPVAAPYNGSAAYTTFAGQPERGAEAVVAQSIDSAP